MLTAFIRAFRTPDLRRKLLFTLFIIAVFRLGSALPAPGISEKSINACIGLEAGSSQAGVYQLVNLFSGGALLRLSVFALGIMPYITASIILQLLTVVIPRLEALKDEGQSGQAKITQYTRYLTIGLPASWRWPRAGSCSPAARTRCWRTTRSSPRPRS
jgi:preprotein translocase subunit SecY